MPAAVTAARPRRRLPDLLGAPAVVALIGGALALTFQRWGPPGGDAAAHLYQTRLWADHGWRFWDNLWYAGRYSLVTYSLLYYPLAAILGPAVVVTASAGLAVGGFAALVRRRWPAAATPPAVAFALLIPLGVVAGTYPFLLGLAAALWALAALQAGRRAVSAVLVAVATAAHPLALAFLVVVLAAMAIADRRWWASRPLRAYALAVAVVLAAEYGLVRAFASDGAHYPFDPKDAVAVVAFCTAGLLLTRGRVDQRPLAAVFAGYGVLGAAALIVPTPVGGNAVRLMLLLGAPLLLIPLTARRFRPAWLAVPALAGTLFWQVLPAVTGWRTAARAEAADAAFWQPVLDFLAAHPDTDHRVEVVATADNWEAWYVARAGVPLARGWFRQDDFPVNDTLYDDPLTPAAYRAWMDATAVRYVFLSTDPLDYTARREAELLRGGRSGLRVVARSGAWTVYERPDAAALVTPAGARVTRLGSDRIRLRVERPGTYRVSLRYTPYMRVSGGGTGACLAPAAPWGTLLTAPATGDVELRFRVTPARAVRAAVGWGDAGCATARSR